MVFVRVNRKNHINRERFCGRRAIFVLDLTDQVNLRLPLMGAGNAMVLQSYNGVKMVL
jgi:hypothetical protein